MWFVAAAPRGSAKFNRPEKELNFIHSPTNRQSRSMPHSKRLDGWRRVTS
jgi:hypothetical protein